MKRHIYITVVTSGLTMLANMVSRCLRDGEEPFDACSELAVYIAKDNGLQWSNVLVQYHDDLLGNPVIPFRVPNKPKEKTIQELALDWWTGLPTWGNPSKEYLMGLYYSDDIVNNDRIEYMYLQEGNLLREIIFSFSNIDNWHIISLLITKHFPELKDKLEKLADETLNHK